jgi:mycothiol S-conjugate amidase
VRGNALLAHATQVDPDSPFWFGLPDDHAAAAYPWDDYVLATSLVDTELPEDDLFAGVREHAAVRSA